MLKTILIAIASVFLAAINCQASDTMIVAKYQRLVHQAGINVAKGNLVNADALYESAFQLTRYPYVEDVKNALYVQVNGPRPDSVKISRLLGLLQQCGICVHEAYEKKEKFLPYLSLANEENCKKVANPSARRVIEAAIEEDQRPRDSARKTYKDSYHPAMMPEIQRVDKLNFAIVDSIYRLADAANVPVHAYIGYEAANSCSIILLHNAGRGRTNKFSLDKLVRKGILDPRPVACRWDECLERGFVKPATVPGSSQGENCTSFREYGCMNTLLTFYGVLIKVPDTPCLSDINRRRQKIFLQDMIEESKIRTFAFYNFKNGFAYPGINILSLPADAVAEVEAKLKKTYKIIKYANQADFDFNRGY